MAKYSDAIDWIAHNDSGDDTPPDMSWADAFDEIRYMLTVVMTADVFGKSGDIVAEDVLKERGFKKPKGWTPP